MQFLLTWVHNTDADKSGLFSFNELLVALRAVPVEYPGGRIEASTFDAPTSAVRMSAHHRVISAVPSFVHTKSSPHTLSPRAPMLLAAAVTLLQSSLHRLTHCRRW